MGFLDLEHARKDGDFQVLKDDPRFKNLVGIIDTSKMSRTEGWRTDLQFLVKEIKRRYGSFDEKAEKEFDAQVKSLHDDIPKLSDSAAQNAATFIERETNAIFIGEPTGASPNFVGEEEPFQLPYSKSFVNVSNLYWQSSSPTDRRTWIAPLIYLPPTFEAYKQNRDLVLEEALNFSEKLK